MKINWLWCCDYEPPLDIISKVARKSSKPSQHCSVHKSHQIQYEHKICHRGQPEMKTLKSLFCLTNCHKPVKY